MKDTSFKSVKGYACKIPANRIVDLALDSASRHLVPDRKVRPTLDVALPTVGGSTTSASPINVYNLLGRLNLGDVPQPTEPTGAGVMVAVIDSGIAVNNDLKTSLGLDRVVLRWSALLGA